MASMSTIKPNGNVRKIAVTLWVVKNLNIGQEVKIRKGEMVRKLKNFWAKLNGPSRITFARKFANLLLSIAGREVNPSPF